MSPYEDPGPRARADGGADARELLDRELRRVTDRLRTFDLSRLERPGPDGQTAAVLAHDTAQALADLAADATRRPRRSVPVLAAHAVADQVTVTGHDLMAEGDDAAVRAGVERVVALRRSL